MSDRIRAIDCPSCGAPLEIPPDHKRLFRCNFCGTTLEDQSTPREQKTGQQPKVIIHTRTTSSSRTYLPSQSPIEPSSSRTGWIVLALILGVVGIAVIIPLILTRVFAVGGGTLINKMNNPRIYNFGPTQLLRSDNDTHPDVVAVTSDSDNTDRMVYIDFDAESHLRWRSEPLSEGAIYIYNQIAASDSAVFMAYKTTLAAFDRNDGTLLWEQSISDQVSNICQDCLQIFNHWVVALTADGMVTGCNVDTGEPAWKVRLNETTRQLLNLGGNIAVLDKENNLVGINVYAPETGTQIQRIIPECPNEIFPDLPQTLGVYDPVLLSNDGKSLYIPISSYDPGCLKYLDATTLKQDWEATIPRGLLDNIGRNPHLLTDEMLVLSDGHSLYAINLLDGSYQKIYSNEDHDMIPISEENGLLLVIAERTRGTSKYALWGIDIQAQSKLWEFNPAAEEIVDSDNFVIHETGAWSANLAAGTPVVFEAFTDPGELAFSLLEPKDGSITDHYSFEVNENDYSYWMQLVDWQGDQLILVMDAGLWWVDARTGVVLATWPSK